MAHPRKSSRPITSPRIAPLRTFLRCFLALAVLGGLASAVQAQDKPQKELQDLRVLYVGTERPEVYVNFLRDHVKEIQAVTRRDFVPSQAEGFDVVLLDWPQGEETREMRKLTSPLGKREDWRHPTVLLGSAGLNLAVAWKMQGGSGCTCLDPVALGFRQHEIFQRPYLIKTEATTKIETPESFRSEISDATIDVIPLVDNMQAQWRPGWCTYSSYFSKNPDVECFCGGVNAKTPTAAALWRQGNLLHYGFEQSPSEMNEVGQQLLLNSIAYIARFSQDLPIATTPSVFAGPISYERKRPASWLKRSLAASQDKADTYNTAKMYHDSVLEMFTPQTRAELEQAGTLEQQIAWCEANARYLHPAAETLLGIDDDLKALGIAFDTREFFARTLADLDSADADAAARAQRLLARYVPCGPGEDATADAWRKWHANNAAYLFALDTGDYCWYIDPLARERGVPTADLRGPARADR